MCTNACPFHISPIIISIYFSLSLFFSSFFPLSLSTIPFLFLSLVLFHRMRVCVWNKFIWLYWLTTPPYLHTYVKFYLLLILQAFVEIKEQHNHHYHKWRRLNERKNGQHCTAKCCLSIHRNSESSSSCIYFHWFILFLLSSQFHDNSHRNCRVHCTADASSICSSSNCYPVCNTVLCTFFHYFFFLWRKR